MNKSELVEAVVAKTGCTKKRAGEIVDGVVAFLTEQLTAGKSISVLGFGSLEVSTRAARTGSNPATGEKLAIPAKKVVRFKPGKLLKAAVAG